MAFFVFFAAAAGTWGVATNLWPFQFNLFDLYLSLWRLGGRTLPLGHRELANLVVCGLADLPDASGPGAGFEMNLEDDVRNPLLDIGQHLAEHPMPLSFVFRLGVLLGPGAHPDTILEMVHIVEMVFPGAVVNLKQNIPFKLA